MASVACPSGRNRSQQAATYGSYASWNGGSSLPTRLIRVVQEGGQDASKFPTSHVVAVGDDELRCLLPNGEDVVVVSRPMIGAVTIGLLLIWGVTWASVATTLLVAGAAIAFFSSRVSAHGLRVSFGAIRRADIPWDDVEELIIMRSRVGWHLTVKTRSRWRALRSLPGFNRLLLSSIVAEIGRSVTQHVADHVLLVAPKKLAQDLTDRPTFDWPGKIEALSWRRS